MTPLLKKAGMDDTNMSSYRPVSNLPQLSKILERIVNRQLIDHLEEFKVIPDVQSGRSSWTFHLNGGPPGVFRSCRHHFQWKASVAVSPGPHGSISYGRQCNTAPRLETTFGVRGITLEWLLSYLEGHTQSVELNGQSTDPRGGFRRTSGFCAGTSAVHTLHSQYRQSDQTVWSQSSYIC